MKLMVWQDSQLDGAERSCRQKEESGDECEGAFDHDTHQSEGQQAEPDERIKNKRKERKRPADNKKDAEEEELEHDVSGFPRLGLGVTAYKFTLERGYRFRTGGDA
jgi:hypothetical protein